MATEKRLIDANELLEKHEFLVFDADDFASGAVLSCDIKQAPTVDAV